MNFQVRDRVEVIDYLGDYKVQGTLRAIRAVEGFWFKSWWALVDLDNGQTWQIDSMGLWGIRLVAGFRTLDG